MEREWVLDCSDKEIDPNEVVEYRTDCEDSFIDNFIDDKLSELW